MSVAKKSCRLCLSDVEFSVSLYGSYCKRTNMLDKILVCLRLPIENNETLDTICYRCANNVEKFHEFIETVKKAQTRVGNNNDVNITESNVHMNKRVMTSYVREQVIDADYTFSFLDMPKEERNEPKTSSPLFSYFSPPKVTDSLKNFECSWKTPLLKLTRETKIPSPKKVARKEVRTTGRPRHHSRDLFESQSQDVEEPEPKSFDWKLTPDDNIIKRVRKNFFGLSNV